MCAVFENVIGIVGLKGIVGLANGTVTALTIKP